MVDTGLLNLIPATAMAPKLPSVRSTAVSLLFSPAAEPGSQLLCADALLLHKTSVTSYKAFLANICRETTASNL